MKKILRMTILIVILQIFVGLAPHADAVNLSVHVSATTYTLDESNQSVTMTVDGSSIILSNIPTSKDYATIGVGYMDDSGEVANISYQTRGSDHTASFSYALVPDGSYTMKFYRSEKKGVTNAIWEDEEVYIVIVKGMAFFQVPAAYASNRVMMNSIPTDTDSLDQFLKPAEPIWRLGGETISIIQSDAPEIISQAKKITEKCKDTYSKIKAIYNWVTENIYYDWDAYNKPPKGDYISALYTLDKKRSICEGYADLTCALLRASGIPAVKLTGYGGGEDAIEQMTKPYNHAWAAAYLDSQKRWVLLETTWGSTNSFSFGEFVKSEPIIGFFDESLHDHSLGHRIAIISSTGRDKWVKTITLESTDLRLKAGECASISASVAPMDATNQNIFWASSDTSIAIVDQAGKVTGISGGNASITVYSTDGTGISAVCNVTVEGVEVASLSLNKSQMTLTEGCSGTLSINAITPRIASNQEVTWESSDKKIATVNNKGVVTAISKGTATISCLTTDGSGVSATCKVTVKADPLMPTSAKNAKYEAEKAVMGGFAFTFEDSAASNGSFAILDTIKSSVIFKKVYKASNLAIAYARDYDYDGKMSLYINNVHYKDIIFPSTGWLFDEGKAYPLLIIPVAIPENANIKLQFDEGDEAINIDYIMLNYTPTKLKATVKFNSAGGSDVASITVTTKDVLSAPMNPTKKGYKFTGWYTAADGGKKVAFPYKVTGNVTLYAHWSE